jgi:aminopeptidase N
MFDLIDGQVRRRLAVELDISDASTPIPQFAGERVPDLVLVNDWDLTYCKIAFDERSIETLKRHLGEVEDPLARALSWGAVWDLARDAALRARDYITLALDNIGAESDTSTLGTLIARIERAVQSYTPPSRRSTARALLARAAYEHFSRAEPGGDTQLLWASTFIDEARLPADIEWVRGLLAGTTQAQGLVADFNVRWRAVETLATIGVAGDDLIARELARDPTDHGQRRAAAARAARPLESAKQEAWRKAIHDRSTSLAMKRAIAAGFHRVGHDDLQQELLSPFVQPYFDSLVPVWESYGVDEAIDIARSMYPQTVITQEVVDATDTALARKDLPRPLRRALLESQDAVKRALRAQAFDTGGTDSHHDA